MRNRLRVYCLFFLILSVGPSARADLMIMIVGDSIPVGGSGFVSVYATSNAPALLPDVINEFGITLRINPAQSTHLEFLTTGQPTDYLADPGYIFAGTTGSYRQNPDPIVGDLVSIFTTNYPNDTASVSDYTLDGSMISLSSANGPLLLARLLVTAEPPDGGVPNFGDLFSIGLIPSYGSNVFGADTYFDIFDADTGLGTAPVPFTSSRGLVSIASPVPEPSSAALTLVAATIGGAFFGLTRRTGF